MRSAVIAATLAGAASAAWAPPAGYSTGWGESSAAPVESATSAPAQYTSVPAQYTTEVVTAYTTYCPKATEITHRGITYTATEATTLTITNCPGGCTVSYPVSSTAPAVTTSVPPVSLPSPVSSSAVVTPYPVANSTVTFSTAPIASTATQTYGSTGSPIASASAPPATGGAAQSYSAIGAAIAAIFGFLATL